MGFFVVNPFIFSIFSAFLSYYRFRYFVICPISLQNNEWNIDDLPSNYIIDAREIQLQRKENIAKLIERGENTLNQISDNLKPKVNEILEKLKNLSQ